MERADRPGSRCAADLEQAVRRARDSDPLATAEQQVFETVRDLLPGVLELTETPWRSEYFSAKAATLYGGTAEIQRNVIARRLLDLGRE
ncbi:acyl-CoA dehydrogenase family protein [Streptomyces sp. NPDC048417]|uniref:acyl-CoA dehydrogenase family protein n=1 Tax=Streptomyces sp. NPDC048417 TaxID=3155387 RepID=UPI0034235EB9